MNYLKSNLNNSSLLPYDCMMLIYEYADPLRGVRDIIESKKYDLNTIMYERMKKYIIEKHFIYHNTYYLFTGDYTNRIEINKDNINDIDLKNNILNDTNGYKSFFLWKTKIFTNICGIEPSVRYEYCYRMKQHLKYTESYKNSPLFYSYNFQEIYQEWLKI